MLARQSFLVNDFNSSYQCSELGRKPVHGGGFRGAPAPLESGGWRGGGHHGGRHLQLGGAGLAAKRFWQELSFVSHRCSPSAGQRLPRHGLHRRGGGVGAGGQGRRCWLLYQGQINTTQGLIVGRWLHDVNVLGLSAIIPCGKVVIYM